MLSSTNPLLKYEQALLNRTEWNTVPSQVSIFLTSVLANHSILKILILLGLEWSQKSCTSHLHTHTYYCKFFLVKIELKFLLKLDIASLKQKCTEPMKFWHKVVFIALFLNCCISPCFLHDQHLVIQGNKISATVLMLM